MGHVKSVVFSARISRPERNSRFYVRQIFHQIRIGYRNIELQVDTTTFAECARHLQSLDRDQVSQFGYSRTAFVEAVKFLGVRASYPDNSAPRWRRVGDSYRLRYRCLTVHLSAAEMRAVAAQFELPRETWKRRLKGTVRRWLRRRPYPDEPLLKERLSIDLCENIHLHFQNLRFEFSKHEFLVLWDAVRNIRPGFLGNFRLATLCSCLLPAETEWDQRLQLEEQAEGHFHLHYRNLRVEFRDFAELGLEFGRDSCFQVDRHYTETFIKPRHWKLAGVRAMRLRELQAVIFTPDAFYTAPLSESPIYQALVRNDQKIYDANTATVKLHDPRCRNDWAGFQSLYHSVKLSGFDPNRLIVTQGENGRIVDGQHRACILLHLFGPETTVKTVHYV